MGVHMKKVLSLSLALFFAFCAIQTAEAATIDYKAEYLGDTSWRYDYTITNDLSFDIGAFAIHFDYGLYDGLDHFTGPEDWDVGGWNPEFWDSANVEIPGQFFGFALEALIAPGDSRTGFSVVFNWFGNEAPDSQFFEVIDPLTFSAVGEGWTIAAPAPIPEPQTFVLLGTGILGLVAYYRRNRR